MHQCTDSMGVHMHAIRKHCTWHANYCRHVTHTHTHTRTGVNTIRASPRLIQAATFALVFRDIAQGYGVKYGVTAAQKHGPICFPLAGSSPGTLSGAEIKPIWISPHVISMSHLNQAILVSTLAGRPLSSHAIARVPGRPNRQTPALFGAQRPPRP